MVLVICVAILDELSSELVHALSVFGLLPSSFGPDNLWLRVNLRRIQLFLTLLEHATLSTFILTFLYLLLLEESSLETAANIP